MEISNCSVVLHSLDSINSTCVALWSGWGVDITVRVVFSGDRAVVCWCMCNNYVTPVLINCFLIIS